MNIFLTNVLCLRNRLRNETHQRYPVQIHEENQAQQKKKSAETGKAIEQGKFQREKDQMRQNDRKHFGH